MWTSAARRVLMPETRTWVTRPPDQGNVVLTEVTIRGCFWEDLHVSPPWDPTADPVPRAGGRGPETWSGWNAHSHEGSKAEPTTRWSREGPDGCDGGGGVLGGTVEDPKARQGTSAQRQSRGQCGRLGVGAGLKGSQEQHPPLPGGGKRGRQDPGGQKESLPGGAAAKEATEELVGREQVPRVTTWA